MTKYRLARIMYRAYSNAAFGNHAQRFNELRQHEQRWWKRAAEDVLGELSTEEDKAEQRQQRFLAGGV